MAGLQGTQKYDKLLRQDLEELASNMWIGFPINGQKAGNFRAVFVIFNLQIAADTTFAVPHSLGEIPVGYIVVGSPTSHVVRLSPGTDSGGNLISWSTKLIYLKSPDSSAGTAKTVTLLLWGTDSSGG